MHDELEDLDDDGQWGAADHAGPHYPVMLKEAIDLLNIQSGKVYVDATAGAGGHLCEIAKLAGKQSRVFGFDRDTTAIENLKNVVPSNVKLIHSNYSNLKERLSEEGVNTVDGGILADLGVSSMQIDDAARGFSFLRDGPLDMRMDPTQSTTAAYLVNTLPERDLADIIYKFGEERHSKKVAKSIVQNRPFETTGKLADVVSRTLNKFQKRGSRRSTPYGSGFQVTKHPATRTFQALRIAVNTELESLENFLEEAVSLLEPGARLVIISFHSLEDRIVKQFLKSKASPCICPPRQPLCTCNKKSELLIITRKPVVADEQELTANIRSRSAKLRAGEKVR